MNVPVDVFNELVRIISLFPDEQHMIERRKRLERKGMSCEGIDSYGIDKDGLEIYGFYRENPVFVEVGVKNAPYTHALER